MKRVALVAYWYPPHNVIGALRASKLAKYLPAFGWAPHVITVAPRNPRHLVPPLEEEPLAAGAVHRTRDLALHSWLTRRLAAPSTPGGSERFAPENVRARGGGWASSARWLAAAQAAYLQLVAFPDEVWPWRFEYGRALDAARDARVQAVISTSPPATGHVMAARLARDLGVPWIADYRDLWTARAGRRRLAPLHAFERGLERRTLAGAAALVTVSEPLAHDLARLLGKPVSVIPNGFDPDDAVEAGSTRLDLGEGFTILHTGSLTHDTRDPRLFLAALDQVLAGGVLPAGRTTAWFVGRNLGVMREALASAVHLAPRVRLEPPVTRAVSLAAQRQATVLLVVDSPRAEHRGVVTGKVFEYLAAERPVLAIGPRGGALDALLAETGGGVLAASAGEAAAALLDWAREWRATGTVAWRGNREAVLRYHRRTLAGHWARLLDRIT